MKAPAIIAQPYDKDPTIRLWEASFRGDVDTLNEALASGGDPNELFAEGTTPLHTAISVNELTCMRILLPLTDPTLKDYKDRTPEQLAQETGGGTLAEWERSVMSAATVEEPAASKPRARRL